MSRHYTAKIKKNFYRTLEFLSAKEGFCRASNKYLASHYNVTNRTIRRWLEELKESKAIKITYVDNYKRKIDPWPKKTRKGKKMLDNDAEYNTMVSIINN